MRRRDFITGLGSATVLSIGASAQQRVLPVIGYLNGTTESGGAHFLRAISPGLGELGYVERRNVSIEYIGSMAIHRLEALAGDLTRRRST